MRILRYLLLTVIGLLLLGTMAPAMELSGDFAAVLAVEPVSIESETSKFKFDMEGILNLELYLGDLSVENAMVLSIGGLQFQAVKLESVLSWLNIDDTFIFAPNIIEFDDDLMNTVVAASPDTGGIVGVPLALFFQDPVSQLDLTRLLSPTLNGPLVFRKKIVEVTTTATGINPRFVILLADLGSTQTPSLQFGGIFEVSGCTPWGVGLSAATYIGARGGGECFGVCKPEERLYSGRVVEGLSLEEEKISITGIELGGMSLGIHASFDLRGSSPGLPKLEIESSFTWQGLQIEQTALLVHGLQLAQDRLSIDYALDDLKLNLSLLDETGNLSYPCKQLKLKTNIGRLQVENLMAISPDSGLYNALTLSIVTSGIELTSKTELLGGGFYSERLGLGTEIAGITFSSDVTFHSGFLLRGRAMLQVEF